MGADGIVSIISFVVGLAIGLFQLYLAQHQFEVQQREKMEELRKILTEILRKITILEAVNSDRSFNIQDKLLNMAVDKTAVSEFAEFTANQVKELVNKELRAAGVAENIEQLKKLEKQVSEIIHTSVNSKGLICTSENIYDGLLRRIEEKSGDASQKALAKDSRKGD